MPLIAASTAYAFGDRHACLSRALTTRVRARAHVLRVVSPPSAFALARGATQPHLADKPTARRLKAPTRRVRLRTRLASPRPARRRCVCCGPQIHPGSRGDREGPVPPPDAPARAIQTGRTNAPGKSPDRVA